MSERRHVPGLPAALAEPPVERDATGCVHRPLEIWGLWHCRLCLMRLDEVELDGGRVVLRARMPLLPP